MGAILDYTGKPLTSLGLLILACLPILCRLWERARRWGRCLCSPPSNWAGWLGGACAVQRQLYQETASHDEGQLQRQMLELTREHQHILRWLHLRHRTYRSDITLFTYISETWEQRCETRDEPDREAKPKREKERERESCSTCPGVKLLEI